jgi:hypothetical protein
VRSRFADVITRQLDLFLKDEAALVTECEDALAEYDAAGRDGAEELYGDYLDVVEAGSEILADMRDRYARTLDEDSAELYAAGFNQAVRKRLPHFALEIENR